jgi:soluble lytic murein transglycosylase
MLRRAVPGYETRPWNSLPQEIWDLLFPLRYYDEVTAQTSKYQLDMNLVLGLIRQESAFDAEARSHANARGLMQILPATGRRLARQAALPKYSTQNLYRPEINVALGCRYFASLLQQFDQRVELALAAYNAGEDRVERWLTVFGDRDMAEFVELIPFSETRDYVKQVITNAALYRQRTATQNGASE